MLNLKFLLILIYLNLKLIDTSDTGKFLIIFGTTRVYKFTFSNVNSMKSNTDHVFPMKI